MMSALGSTAAFLPSLLGGERKAQAVVGTVPRIVIMTSSHQLMPDSWRQLRGNEAAKAFEYALSDVPNAELSPVLAKLAPYKDRVLAVDGLSLASGIPNTGFFQGHALSASNLLAAAGYNPNDEQFLPRGPTVDQVIARGIAHADRIPSLELSTSNNVYVATDFKERPPVEQNPANVAKRLFPADLSAEPTREELLEIESTSVLDLTARQYETLLPRLSSEDRQKLDLHRQMIRDLERRQLALRSLACTEPDEVWAKGSKLETVRQFAKLIGAAFACDATRVATIQVSQLANGEFGAPAGDVHQDYAHQADKSESAAAEMRKYTVALAEIFGTIVDELAQYSDLNGNLLESTLVVWMAEHGLTFAAHTATEHGALIAGNVNGYFRTGRYVSLPRATRHPKQGQAPMGVPHSHLLVSLMQACGLSNDSIGSTEYEVYDGTKVSLTGPIDALR
jgi:hypothetical protein